MPVNAEVKGRSFPQEDFATSTTNQPDNPVLLVAESLRARGYKTEIGPVDIGATEYQRKRVGIFLADPDERLSMVRIINTSEIKALAQASMSSRRIEPETGECQWDPEIKARVMALHHKNQAGRARVLEATNRKIAPGLADEFAAMAEEAEKKAQKLLPKDTDHLTTGEISDLVEQVVDRELQALPNLTQS